MNMAARRLGNLNLNLLKTLHAVLQHRSVTRAAEEMNLTQAAVSNNLRKLRDHFRDPLVVKDGRALRLTPRAASLLGPLDETLAGLARILVTEPFDPAFSSQHFRITAASNISAILMPPLANILAKEAAGVCLQIVGGTASTAQDLKTDKIDLVIGPPQVVAAAGMDPANPAHGCSAEYIRTEQFVCLVREGHPALENGIDRESYLSMPHASFFVDLGMPGSIEHGFIEANRMKQFNRMLTSDYAVLPMIAATSDLIVLTPESLAAVAMKAHPLVAFPCPIEVPELELWSFWNRDRDDDESLRWLRALVKRGIIRNEAEGGAMPFPTLGYS